MCHQVPTYSDTFQGFLGREHFSLLFPSFGGILALSSLPQAACTGRLFSQEAQWGAELPVFCLYIQIPISLSYSASLTIYIFGIIIIFNLLQQSYFYESGLCYPNKEEMTISACLLYNLFFCRDYGLECLQKYVEYFF